MIALTPSTSSAAKAPACERLGDRFGGDKATRTVLEQAEALSAAWAV